MHAGLYTNTHTYLYGGMYTHTHTYTHAHTQTHTYTHKHTHTYTHTQTHTHTHTHTHARTHARTHAHAHARTHTHIRRDTHTLSLSISVWVTEFIKWDELHLPLCREPSGRQTQITLQLTPLQHTPHGPLGGARRVGVHRLMSTIKSAAL